MSKSTPALIFMLAATLFVFSVKAQERDDSRLTPAERNRSGSLRQLAPGYYVFSSTSFNSGVIATSEGVIVLDALTSEAIARQEREAIASEIKQPVRFLVSSTFHNNYTWGNVAYRDVVKIGHEDYRTDLLAQMQRDHASPEEQKARLPQITYRDRLTIHLGGKEIQVLYLGKGHTRSDSIIFVPQDRIAYERVIFLRPISLHQRRLRRELAENTGCGRSSPSRHHRAGAWPHSRRSQRNPPRASSVSSDAGRFARRRSKRNRPRGDGRSSRRRNQTSSVRTHAGIQIPKRSRRAADVPGNDGHA